VALVIYSNGIFEEFLPVNDTFSDQELVDIFKDYEEIRSFRLAEIPNCWLLWGKMESPPENEYNKLASEIIDEDIFSHLIFLHDSEFNRNWKVTDDILYKDYNYFIKHVGEYIKDMVNYIAHETQKEYEEAGTTSMIFLRAIGYTKDKRVLYVFNPNEQNEEFYIDGWDKFSVKIYDYLSEHFDKEIPEENKPLVIFADTKVIVIVEDENVNSVIGNVLSHFEKRENYEACSFISDVREKWFQRKTIPKNILDPSIGNIKKRRGRPPKNKNNDEKAD
jgi:nitrogen regulatory protein PII